MGKRVSIYLPDDVLLSIQETARRDGRSISNYLVQLYKSSGRGNMGFFDEAGSISEEVYKHIKTENKPAQPDKFESHRSIAPIAKKRVKNIVEEIPLALSASNIFNPQPKGKK